MKKNYIVIPITAAALALISWANYSVNSKYDVDGEARDKAFRAVLPTDKNTSIDEEAISEFYQDYGDFKNNYYNNKGCSEKFYVNSHGAWISKAAYLKLLEYYEPTDVSEAVNSDTAKAAEDNTLQIGGAVTEADDVYLQTDDGAKLNKDEFIKFVTALNDADAAVQLVNSDIINDFKAAKSIKTSTKINETKERTEKVTTVVFDNSKELKVVTYDYKTVPSDKGDISIEADVENLNYYKGVLLYDANGIDYPTQLDNYTTGGSKVTLKQNIPDKTENYLRSVLVAYGDIK